MQIRCIGIFSWNNNWGDVSFPEKWYSMKEGFVQAQIKIVNVSSLDKGKQKLIT